MRRRLPVEIGAVCYVDDLSVAASVYNDEAMYVLSRAA
jgi:hypothetical protein